MRTRQKGFSLIELLIVVAIILIIAAIAIPNLLRSRMAANEASAVGSIRTINTSAVTYSSTYPNAGFPATLAVVGRNNALHSYLDKRLLARSSSCKRYEERLHICSDLGRKHAFRRLLDYGNPSNGRHHWSAYVLL